MNLRPDTVAVVTGAAHGIGRAIVRELAARGVRVVALDVDAAGLTALADGTSGCRPFVCDVADVEAVSRVASDVAESVGPVTLVINCAGVSVAGAVEALSLAQLHRAMDVNYWGVVHVCRAFLPALRATAAGGGSAAICNVLSDFAFFALPTKAAYAASKHAAHAFTLALAAELSGTGVAVTAAYPGATATDLVMRGDAVESAQRAREAAVLARGMSADNVARRIVRGVERGRSRILIGNDTRVLAFAMGWAPGLTQRAVRRFWRRIEFL